MSIKIQTCQAKWSKDSKMCSPHLMTTQDPSSANRATALPISVPGTGLCRAETFVGLCSAVPAC